MPTELPGNRILIESLIATAIKTTIESIVGNNPDQIPANQMPIVWTRNRFPDSDEEDIQVTTRPNPVMPSQLLTSVIEIGVPTVEESAYTGYESTQLEFTYPIGYEQQLVDQFNDPTNVCRFKNTRDLVMAVFMLAGGAIKRNFNLGYTNVSHKYLQQVSSVTIEDDKSSDKAHIQDWSLTVQVTSVTDKIVV